MKVGKKRAWSKAASVALAATLGAFMCVPAVSAVVPQEAWATDSITINDSDDSTATFTGYKIFSGTVTDGTGGKTINGISWANGSIKSAVEGAIKTWHSAHSSESGESGYTKFDSDGSFNGSAQDAADYIAGHITSNSSAVASDSFANALAKAIEEANLTATVTVTSGTKSSEQSPGGYYFFKTSLKESDKNTATSPIYAIIGGTDVTATAKKSVPTVDKKVKDESDSDVTHTEAAIGDELSFTLTGTLPSNYATYEKYSYEFDDTLSKGLDFVTASDTFAESDVTVKVGSATLTTDQFEASYNSSTRKLEVKISDLKTISGVTVDSSTSITVDYKAKLNSNASTGSTGENNQATIKYSNDPHTNGTGESGSKEVKVYTFKLNLNKVDRDTETALTGAKFTLQRGALSGSTFTASSDTAGSYVTAAGSAGSYTVSGHNTASGTELEVGTGGELNVTGLDAGTYKVHESTPPTGYNAVDDFYITITPSYGTGTNADALTDLTNTLSATNGQVVAGSTDGSTGDNSLGQKASNNDAATASSGQVKVTVGDAKNVGLPVTGMSGISWTFVVGGAVLILTIGYAVHASRKRREEQE